MEDTGYNPPTGHVRAATEYQTAPPRGMVRGEVHDENAWSLGGVAGHAGVFSTADDLAILSQALLDGGTYGGHRILDPSSVELLVTDFNQAFPGDSHGLGFELDQRWYMDALPAPRPPGHTGYTGTSVVIDFASRSFAILLTNRVHPSPRLGLGQHRSPRVGPRPGQRPTDPTAGGAHVLVCREFRREDRHPDDGAPRGRRRRSPPRLRPPRRQRETGAAPRAVH